MSQNQDEPKATGGAGAAVTGQSDTVGVTAPPARQGQAQAPADPTAVANMFDPFGVWKPVRDANMDAWSKAAIEFTSSEAYSRATAQLLDGYLTASQPFQKLIEQTMTRTLAALNMPSRAEVITLAERMTNIELRLDDMDAKLDDLRRLIERGPRPAAKGRAMAGNTIVVAPDIPDTDQAADAATAPKE